MVCGMYRDIGAICVLDACEQGRSSFIFMLWRHCGSSIFITAAGPSSSLRPSSFSPGIERILRIQGERVSPIDPAMRGPCHAWTLPAITRI